MDRCVEVLVVADDLMKLCRFLAEIRFSSVPEPVVDSAKRVLLDTIGVITAGSRTREVSLLAERLPAAGLSSTGATCPGRKGPFAPIWAALLNGMAGSSLEFEEGNSAAMGHPAIQVVPAVLAECESSDLSGKDLLSGLLLGYEAASRVGRATTLRRGLHPTGTWGTVGSALGVGRCRRKTAEAFFRTAHIAASYAFSPYVRNSFEGKNAACTFAGQVNYIGIFSNTLEECGIEADEGSLEMTFSRFISDRFEPPVLTAGLGEEYAIADGYLKPYPTCRFTHPALDALKAILLDTDLSPGDVAGVRVVSFRAAVHAGPNPPNNMEAMRFSLPYLIAAMLIHGRIDLSVLKDELLHDPRVKELAGNVELVLSEEYEKVRPQKNPARVSLRLRDGREISREVISPLGDPANAMPPEAVAEKFLSLAGPVIGDARARECVQRISHLESESSILPIMALLRAG